MDLIICQSFAVIIFGSDQSLGLKASSACLQSPFDMTPVVLGSSLFGMVRCFGHILYIFCLRSGISHYSREFCLVLGTWYLETTVYILGTNCLNRFSTSSIFRPISTSSFRSPWCYCFPSLWEILQCKLIVS